MNGTKRVQFSAVSRGRPASKRPDIGSPHTIAMVLAMSDDAAVPILETCCPRTTTMAVSAIAKPKQYGRRTELDA
jgi:hypothetical protein